MNYQKPIYKVFLRKKPFLLRNFVVANAFTDDPEYYHDRKIIGYEQCFHKTYSCACWAGKPCNGTGLCTEAEGCGQTFQAHLSKVVSSPFTFSVGGLSPMDTNKYCPACGLEKKMQSYN